MYEILHNGREIMTGIFSKNNKNSVMQIQYLWVNASAECDKHFVCQVVSADPPKEVNPLYKF